MKKAKALIYILITLIEIVVFGEIGIDNLESFAEGIRYVHFESKNMEVWECFCKEIDSLCQDNGINLFAVKIEHESLKDGCISVFLNMESDSITDCTHITPGEYKSVFSGEMRAEMLPFCDIYEKNDVTTMNFYMYGDEESVKNVYQVVNDKYGTSRLRVDLRKSGKYIRQGILIIGTLFILILTIFDMAFQKKTVFVRMTLGESVYSSILKNQLIDVCGGILITTIACVTFIPWISPVFYLKDIFLCLIVTAVINSLMYLSMARYDVRSALTSNYNDSGLIFHCYILFIMMTTATILLLSYAVDTSINNNEYIRLYKEIGNVRDYSHLSLRYYNYSANMSKREMNLTYELVKKGIEEYEILFSTVSIDFDENVYLNVNENAKVLLHDIKELDNIDEQYRVHILIPKCYFDKTDYYLSNALQSGKCMIGTIDTLEYEVLYYEKADVLYFDEDTDNNCAMAKNPIICYITGSMKDLLSSYSEENVGQFGHEYRNILFKIDDGDKNKLSSDLSLSLNGFYLSVENVMTKYLNLRNQMLRKVYSGMVLSALLIFAGIILIGVIVRLEFLVKRLELVLKRLLGYSLANRNRGIIMSVLFSFVMGYLSSIGVVLMSKFVDMRYLLSSGLMIGIAEFIILFIFIDKMEKANIVATLKGGNA